MIEQSPTQDLDNTTLSWEAQLQLCCCTACQTRFASPAPNRYQEEESGVWEVRATLGEESPDSEELLSFGEAIRHQEEESGVWESRAASLDASVSGEETLTSFNLSETVRFEDATNSAGIAFVSGISFGSSWGDFNGDTFPDLYVSNHYRPVSLYLNNGDGTFTDIAADTLSEQGRDTHAAAWADFDNDGDQDIIQFTGAGQGMHSESNLLYVNDGQSLVNRATELGVRYPFARSRTPLWFDHDNDGWLDLVWTGAPRPDRQSPNTIFRQNRSGFEDVGLDSGFDVPSSSYGFLADISGDEILDLVINNDGLGGFNVYDTTALPFNDLRGNPQLSWGADVASADLNGDLRPDLFSLVRDWGLLRLFKIILAMPEQGLHLNKMRQGSNLLPVERLLWS